MMPNKTLAFKNEKCSNGKLSKERVTILLGANCDGSEKLPVLLIGKSVKPRAFQRVKTLPLRYGANKKAWMTFSEWSKYVTAMDEKFGKQKRNVLFVIDNAPPHLPIEGLKNIKMAYLPPNTTSPTQPMDQGIIKNFKLIYREFVVKKIINEIDKNNMCTMASSIKIDLLDAVHFTKKAWDRVKSDTIANCFRKAGFCSSLGQNSTEETIESNETNLQPLWSQQMAELAQRIDFNDYVMVDEGTAVCEEITDEAIIRMVGCDIQNISDDSDADIEFNETTDSFVLRSVSIPEANDALEKLRIFLSSRKNTEEELDKLYWIENSIDARLRSKTKQDKITTYFDVL